GILENTPAKTNWVNNVVDDGEEVIAKPDELLIESLRIEEVPSTHTVLYSSEVDQIEFKHTAHSRTCFALGAVVAAEWIQDKKCFYQVTEMFDFILQCRIYVLYHLCPINDCLLIWIVAVIQKGRKTRLGSYHPLLPRIYYGAANGPPHLVGCLIARTYCKYIYFLRPVPRFSKKLWEAPLLGNRCRGNIAVYIFALMGSRPQY